MTWDNETLKRFYETCGRRPEPRPRAKPFEHLQTHVAIRGERAHLMLTVQLSKLGCDLLADVLRASGDHELLEVANQLSLTGLADTVGECSPTMRPDAIILTPADD